MRYTLHFIFILFLFQGCTSNPVPMPQAQTDYVETDPIHSNDIDTNENNDTDDTFEDEFSSEGDEEIIDPLSGYNTMMTTFNDTAFTYGINPISEAYAFVVPELARQSVANFLHNLQFPIRITNNLLQGKFQNSSDELERFIVNSTVGLAGLFDPAGSQLHISAHNEDFGQTLGHYGVGAGFHIVLPFLGPSNVRDVLGLTVDGYTSPLIYQKGLKKYKIPKNYVQSIGIYSSQMINKNALNLGAYESLKKDAIELYPFLRELYEQKRTADIEE